MLFNSLHFLIFFPIVVIVYFVLPFRLRWKWLLVSSYYFYMNWEPIYALLLLFSTVITFVAARGIANSNERRVRRLWLGTSLTLNFAVLGLFKYYNFLTTNIVSLLEAAGMRLDVPEFRLLLPVGISFYIFQAAGYTIDVYRNKISPERNLGKYALFVSFFPQLVAGPIERTGNLLPQLSQKHFLRFPRFFQGLRLMLIGYFMKLVVADRLAIYVDTVYNNSTNHSGTTLALATFFFSFQIYCDFAGYSAIAVGAARIMGIKLMTNFRRPYLSKSVAEFWRRWHISLSTWFKDYLYISLGGNRVKSKIRLYLNLLVTFLVSGLWHGSNWTFVIWGGLNGLYLILENFLGFRMKLPRMITNVFSGLRVLYVFCLIYISWIFFRAKDLTEAINILKAICTFSGRLFIPVDPELLANCFLSLVILISSEIFYETIYKDRQIRFNRRVFTYIQMICLLFLIMLIGVFDGGQFIYFQF